MKDATPPPPTVRKQTRERTTVGTTTAIITMLAVSVELSRLLSWKPTPEGIEAILRGKGQLYDASTHVWRCKVNWI